MTTSEVSDLIKYILLNQARASIKLFLTDSLSTSEGAAELAAPPYVFSHSLNIASITEI